MDLAKSRRLKAVKAGGLGGELGIGELGQAADEGVGGHWGPDLSGETIADEESENRGGSRLGGSPSVVQVE